MLTISVIIPETNFETFVLTTQLDVKRYLYRKEYYPS